MAAKSKQIVSVGFGKLQDELLEGLGHGGPMGREKTRTGRVPVSIVVLPIADGANGRIGLIVQTLVQLKNESLAA